MALPVDVTPPFSPPDGGRFLFVYTLRCAPHRLVKFEHKFEHWQCRRAMFEQDLDKMPWQRRRLEMKGLTASALV